MKPIGVYVRVSSRSGRDDDRFHSPREQADRARGLCYARGLEPGPTFEDIDVSGAILPAERPAMSRLLYTQGVHHQQEKPPPAETSGGFSVTTINHNYKAEDPPSKSP